MGDHDDSLSYLDNLLDTSNFKNLNLVRGNAQQFAPWLNLITRHNVVLLDSFRSWCPFRPLHILNRLFVIIYIEQQSILLLQLLVTVSNDLSATTWKLAPTGGLSFCRTVIPSNMVVALSGYLSVTSIRLQVAVKSSTGLSSEVGQRDRQGTRRRRFSFRFSETAQAEPLAQTKLDPFVGESQDPWCAFLS